MYVKLKLVLSPLSSSAETVMVTVPDVEKITSPVLSTVAVFGSLLVQVKACRAFAGSALAVN